MKSQAVHHTSCIENPSVMAALAHKKRGRTTKPWNSEFVLFSVVNSELTRNVRSYFDRWREREDASGLDYNNWSLQPTWVLASRSPKASSFPVAKSCIRAGLTREFF